LQAGEKLSDRRFIIRNRHQMPPPEPPPFTDFYPHAAVVWLRGMHRKSMAA
jgi:hypothetical protein